MHVLPLFHWVTDRHPPLPSTRAVDRWVPPPRPTTRRPSSHTGPDPLLRSLRVVPPILDPPPPIAPPPLLHATAALQKAPSVVVACFLPPTQLFSFDQAAHKAPSPLVHASAEVHHRRLQS
jgi:hypothetical protein